MASAPGLVHVPRPAWLAGCEVWTKMLSPVLASTDSMIIVDFMNEGSWTAFHHWDRADSGMMAGILPVLPM